MLSGDLWPRFLYRYFEYNPEDPWEGLLRSSLLVMVSLSSFGLPIVAWLTKPNWVGV